MRDSLGAPTPPSLPIPLTPPPVRVPVRRVIRVPLVPRVRVVASTLLTVFPAGGQATARRNAATAVRADEQRARAREEAWVAVSGESLAEQAKRRGSG
jgi:hypothetical protein